MSIESVPAGLNDASVNSLRQQVMKLRPVEKTPEEIEEDKKLYFQLPRKTCAQISPAVKRMENIEKHSEAQHVWHVLKRIMKRARVKNVDDKVIPYLQAIDRSEKVIPEGEVSKKLYMDIFHSREIDLYGKLVRPTKHPYRKFLELKYLASQLGIEHTQEPSQVIKEKVDEPNEEDIIRVRNKAIKRITTESWKIGNPEKYHAPVGWASNPAEPSNSLGNEYYFSYDGAWRDGRMNGYGTYLFEDGETYEGLFKDNRMHGDGVSRYKGGRVYSGEWKEGKFSGKGSYSTVEGIKYDGEFTIGLKHGIGTLEFPSGLIYKGEFQNGKPHGKGMMTSKLTEWTYIGSFEEGYICGTGSLISPPPALKQIPYFWAEQREKVLLPGLVRAYLDEQKEERARVERLKHQMMAPLQGEQLKDYVQTLRSNLYNDRIREKKQKQEEYTRKIKEQKQKLHEARLKALAGDSA